MLSLQQGRSLKEFSTFGIGGPIHLLTEARSLSEMQEIFQWIQREKIPFLILGKGSNCLFDDRGFDGLAIINKIDFCHWAGNEVSVGSGYSFSLLGVQSARKGFAGLEFASGIPATVGGAVFMNAGANGSETWQVLRSIQFLSLEGEFYDYPKEELEFGYRYSSFQKKMGVIVSAAFTLSPSKEARARQLAIVETRLSTQPYREKSIGCIFRNPSPEKPAGLLIDQCGLKGAQIGGAKISPVHANFMINSGDASAKDVLDLIQMVQERVREQTGWHLEPEIRMIGFS
ncbi:MAG TPA: UDP-N-acetylenolpyruvoylglucosamine reductase [Parachlamydiales bacterium]|nr:UDP-N-acetylenolpyruvoylglucosamine reductase [Parachlamydiales bacterium]